MVVYTSAVRCFCYDARIFVGGMQYVGMLL